MKNSIFWITISILLIVTVLAIYSIPFWSGGKKQIVNKKNPETINTNSDEKADLKVSNQNLKTYTNNIAGYSFEYPDTLGIQWADSGTETNPSDSGLIYLSPISSMGQDGMTFDTINPMTDKDYPTEGEQIRKEIIDYYASSTANFLYPENNKITQKPSKTGEYKYEIEWSDITDSSNSSDGTSQDSGIIVMHVYPVKVNETNERRFLQIYYSKDDSELYASTIESLKINK